MRILITGAGGFIGSHFTEAMVAAGHEVVALVHYNGQGRSGWLDSIPGNIRDSFKIFAGDITDTEFINDICKGIDVVVNFAALIAIPYSYVAPRSYMQTNALGTLNICEAVRQSNSRLIQISTSEVYGTPDTVPISENHPLKPQSPYAASKVAADQIALSYFRSFGTPVTIMRPFNTFGPRQSMRAVVPTILSQMLTEGDKVVLGDLSPKRDFTFVEDTVSAIRLAVTNEDVNGEVIQLGTGRTVTIAEIVKISAKLLGFEKEIEIDPMRIRPKASEVQILLSDPSKVNARLGWSANTTLEEGLQKTIDWLRSNVPVAQESKKYWI